MSMNHVVQDAPKRWFNATFKNLSVVENFGYLNLFKQEDYVLKLVRDVDGFLVALWSAVAPSNIYNNQVDIAVRSKSYSAINDPIVFSGFKYAAPSYYNLSADKKTLLISSQGNYLVTFTFGTFDLEESCLFAAYVNGEEVPESFVSFIPARPVSDLSKTQYTTCTSTFFFATEPGVNTLQIKIVPNRVVAIDLSSIVTVIKMSRFD